MPISRRARKRIALLLILVVVVGAGLGGAYVYRKSARAKEIDRGFTVAMTAMKEERYEEALPLLSDYVAKHKDDYDALMAFAKARRNVPQVNRRHLTTAAELYRVAHRIRDDVPEPLEALLEIYPQIGRNLERIEVAEKLLEEIDGAHQEAMRALVQGYAAQGNDTRAVRSAEALTEAFPDDVVGFEMLYELMHRSGTSDEDIRKHADESVGRRSDARFKLLHAWVCVLTGDEEEATNQLVEVIDGSRSKSDWDPDTLERVLLLSDQIGPVAIDHSDEGVRTLADLVLKLTADVRTNISTGDVDSSMAIVFGERAWDRGSLESVREFLQPVVDQDPASIDEWTLGILGLSLEGDGDEDARERVVEELRSRKNEDARAWLLVFEGREFEVGRDSEDGVDRQALEEARAKYREAAQLDPGNGVALYLLAETHTHLEDAARAEQLYREVLRLEPRWIKAWIGLVRTLNDLGQNREAASVALYVNEQWPGLAGLIVLDALVTLIQSGEADEALREETLAAIEKTRAQMPTASMADLYRLRILAGTDNVEEIRTTIRTLLEHDDLDARQLLTIEGIARAKGIEDPDPKSILDRVESMAPSSPEFVLRKSLRLHQAGRTEDGLALLDREVEQATGDAKAGFELLRIDYRLQTGDDDAFEDLVALAETHEDKPTIQAFLLTQQRLWVDEMGRINTANADLIGATLDRYKEQVGEESDQWRAFEARRLLSFSPRDGSEAERIATDVVALLHDQTQGEAADPASLILRGEAYVRMGRASNAIAHYSRAVDRLPADRAPYRTLINLLRDTGRTDEAVDRVREYARAPGLSIEKRRECAELMESFGLMTEATALYRGIAADPDVSGPLDGLRLAYVLVRRGRVDEAQAIIDEIELASDRLPPEVHRNIANFYALVDRMDTGLERLAALEPEVGEATMLYYQGALLRRHERQQEALAKLRSSHDLDPSNTDCAKELSWLLMDLDEGDEVEPVIAATRDAIEESGVLDETLDSEFAMIIEAAAMRESGDGVGQLIEMMANANPADAAKMQGLYEIVLAWSEEEIDAPTYEARLRAFISRYPTFFPARVQLVNHLMIADRPTEAAAEGMRGLDVIRTDPRMAELAVVALMNDGQYDQAIGVCRTWESLAGTNRYPVHRMMATAQLERGRPTEAIRTLQPHRSRIVADPDRDDHRMGVAILLRAYMEDREDPTLTGAQTLANQVLASSEEIRPVVVGAVEHLFESPNVARSWIEQYGVPSGPGSMQTVMGWVGIARASREEADVAQANTRLSQMGDNPQVLALRAQLQEIIRKLDEAASLYQQALDALPGGDGSSIRHTLLNNLAYLRLKQGEASEDIVEEAKEAVSLARADRLDPRYLKVYLDTYGTALHRVGRSEEAKAIFREAYEIDRTYVNALVGLAEVQVALGERDTAEANIDMAVALQGMESPELAERIKAIQAALDR